MFEMKIGLRNITLAVDSALWKDPDLHTDASRHRAVAGMVAPGHSLHCTVDMVAPDHQTGHLVHALGNDPGLDQRSNSPVCTNMGCTLVLVLPLYFPSVR
jgi:hypothetical protein